MWIIVRMVCARNVWYYTNFTELASLSSALDCKNMDVLLALLLLSLGSKRISVSCTILSYIVFVSEPMVRF